MEKIILSIKNLLNFDTKMVKLENGYQNEWAITIFTLTFQGD
jgi:hypothetical protein